MTIGNVEIPSLVDYKPAGHDLEDREPVLRDVTVCDPTARLLTTQRRVAILWSDLSGYFNAGLHALAAIPGVSLFVAHSRLLENAPFDDQQFRWIPEKFVWSDASFDGDALLRQLRTFNPDTIVISGWVRPEYRRCVRSLASTSVRVMTMDNQWTGRARQWVGRVTAPWFIQPLADAAWVAGERQALFASRLGFAPDRIFRGCYSCDQPAFSAVADPRRTAGNRSFAVIARLIPEKNMHRLAAAYTQYRERCVQNRMQPWPLRCYGDGPLRDFLCAQPGIEVHGFVQPSDLPAQLALASALVLPSTFEPWGIVVHEAASAGLGLLLSRNAGASVHLLQDGYNGWLFDPLNVADISQALLRFASQPSEEIEKMSCASSSLALQYTPARWASYLLDRTAELISQRRAQRSSHRGNGSRADLTAPL